MQTLAASLMFADVQWGLTANIFSVEGRTAMTSKYLRCGLVPFWGRKSRLPGSLRDSNSKRKMGMAGRALAAKEGTTLDI